MTMEKNRAEDLHAHRTLAQTRSRRTRDNILQIARIRFAAHGFDAASVRDIANEAGVTHTVIRYHFGSKMQLWKDVVTGMYEELDTVLDPSSLGLAQLPAGDGLRAWLQHYIRYCAHNPEHARIVIQESLVSGERQEWMDQYVRSSHERMLPLFQTLIRTKDLPNVWIISLFYSISAMCQLPFVLSNSVKGTYGVDMRNEEAIEAHADSVLALLFRDVPPSRSAWPAVVIPVGAGTNND